MSSFLICCTPAHGHVTPLLAVARQFTESGHRVRFLTGSRYRAAVEATGAEFIPLPPEADVNLDDPNSAFPRRAGLTGIPAIKFDISNLFLAPATAQMRTLESVLEKEPADAVLAEPTFLGIAALLPISREHRPAIVVLGIVPLVLPDPDVAPGGFGLPPMPGRIGRIRNGLLSFVAERIVFAPVLREATRVIREAGSDATPTLDWIDAADAIIQFTVPQFEYPRSTLPEHVHFVGPVTRTRSSDAPLPDWWDRLDDGRPVVHVTQGTVANKDFGELIAPAIAGLAPLDVHVVVSTGGRPIAELPQPLPPNVLAAPFLPYDKLLPRTDVLLTNGGYGGVHYALEHGVPLVVAGMTEDKMEVSARVAWSGTGINLRTNRPRPARIAAAVTEVLGTERYRRASERIAAEIASSPGLGGVETVVASLLRE